jgi:hypothetical protein
MKRRKPAIVESGATLPLKEVLASVGIQLLLWSETLEYADLSLDTETLSNMAHEMLVHSEVLALVEQQFPKLSVSMRIRMPDDIGVMRIPNPLRERRAAEADAEASANDDDVLGELPF